MATSLFTQLISNFKGDTLNTVASVIGESPARTESALGSVLQALISGLASKASTHGQATDLLDIISGNDLDSPKWADPASAFKDPGDITGLGNTGRFLMESIFGGRAGSLVDWTASRSGISRSAASSLLNLALPIVLGMIAKNVKSAGWNASNLTKLLGDQRSSLPDMPDLEAAPGPDVATERVHAALTLHDPIPTSRATWMWILPLLLLIPLFAYVMSRGNEVRRVAENRTVSQPAPAAARKTAIPESATPVGTSGVSSVARPQSGLYRIEFHTGSSGVTSASADELRDVAAILNAHARARADISGYTDDSGDAEANRRLSEIRATTMMNELLKLGVDPSRMTVQGYGEDDPVADNVTAEGRQRNRRVEIRVTSN